MRIRLWQRILAGALCATLILLSPGQQAWAALPKSTPPPGDASQGPKNLGFLHFDLEPGKRDAGAPLFPQGDPAQQAADITGAAPLSTEDLTGIARDQKKKITDRIEALRLVESQGKDARPSLLRLAQNATLAVDLGHTARDTRLPIADRIAALRALRALARALDEAPAAKEVAWAISQLGANTRDERHPPADRVSSVRILQAFGSPQARVELKKSARDADFVAALQVLAADRARPQNDRMAAMASLNALGTNKAPKLSDLSTEDLAGIARNQQKNIADRIAAIRIIESRGEEAQSFLVRLAQDAPLSADLGQVARNARQPIADRVTALRALRAFIRAIEAAPAVQEVSPAIAQLGANIRDRQQVLADRVASVRILDAFGSPQARAELEKSATDAGLVAEFQAIAADRGKPKNDRMVAMAGLDALGTTEARIALEIVAYDNKLDDMGLQGVRSISGHLVSVREKIKASEQKKTSIIPLLTYESDLSVQQKKTAVMGLFGSRFFSMVAGSLITLAYTPMIIKAVGTASMFTLGVLGGIIAIGLALAVGKIMDGIQNKKSAVLFNFALRAVISFITAAAIGYAMLSFPSLLVLTALSTLQFALLFVLDFAMMADLATNEHDLRSNEAMIRIATILVTVGSGLWLGKHVDGWGYMKTFLIAGAGQMLPVLVLWRTIPAGIGRKVGAPQVDNARVNAEFLKHVRASRTPPILAPVARLWNSVLFTAVQLHKAGRQLYAILKATPRRTWLRWASYGLLFAGLAVLFLCPLPPLAYPVFHFSPLSVSWLWTGPVTFLTRSALPSVIVAAWLLLKSPSYTQVIAKNPMLKWGLAFIMICAFMELPMRNSVLGVLATETAGKGAGSSELFGKLLASFYMGQMPTGTGMISPHMTTFKQAMKWFGALSMAAWVGLLLLPRSLILGPGIKLSLAALLSAHALISLAVVFAVMIPLYIFIHNLTPKIKQRDWLGAESKALLVLGFLPILFHLAPWSLYLSLAIFGMVHNPTTHTVSANFTATLKRLMPNMVQYFSGFRGAFVNIATSIALATYGTAKQVPLIWGESHAFPFTWYVIAAINVAFFVLFRIGQNKLPFDDNH